MTVLAYGYGGVEHSDGALIQGRGRGTSLPAPDGRENAGQERVHAGILRSDNRNGVYVSSPGRVSEPGRPDADKLVAKVKVQIPGIAYGVLAGGRFPKEQEALWKRIQDYSISLARGRGITVHINVDKADWAVIREAMLQEVQRLNAMPYAERGLEGSVELQSLQVAIGRIDEVVR